MALWKARLTIAAMAAVALFSASAAKAANPACESLPGPIYITGSSASQPIWNQIGPGLSAAGVSLVYQPPGSCVGPLSIEAIQDAGPTAAVLMGSSTYWFPDGGSGSCTSNSDPVDVGASDVYQSTCDIVNNVTNAPTIGRYNGPTQVMTFIRPIDTNNNQMPNEISAEQAYFVFSNSTQNGDGIAPWNQPNEDKTTYTAGTDPAFLFVRNSLSGTQSMIAEALLLNPSLFGGYNAGGTKGVITDVNAAAGTTNDQSVMGICVAGGGYDTNRAKVQALAFRGYQQEAAWLPDSSATSFDKQNVRNGLYTVAGPLQILFAINNSGKTDISAATDPAAVKLVNYLNGTTAVPGAAKTIEQYEIAASVIPDCAMGVTRFDTSSAGGNTEGAMVPNTVRQHSCDCYFESQVTNSTVTCTACTGPSGCPGGYCGPNGVCEAF